MTADTLSLSAAFMVGLLGGAHCIGMCGGITGAFGLNTQGTPITRTLKNIVFNFGRIISYGLIGLLLGYLSSFFSSYSPTIGMILRIVAGICIILMGLYVADWSRLITKIEKPGQWLWKHIQPLTKPLLPANSLPKAFGLGLLWGWLPCGLVYSTLVLALASSSSLDAAFIMFTFGLGTLPTMLATGLLASQLSNFIRSKYTRNIAAILMITMGVWILWGNGQHLIGHGSHSGMDHSQMDHSKMNDNEKTEIDHSTMNHDTMNHDTIDHSKMDHSNMDHSKMNH